MKVELLVFTVILTRCCTVEGARILAVLPFFGRSHHRFTQPLLKTLARAGHQVVVYSPYPLDTPVPNYIDVFMDNVSAEKEIVKELAEKYSKSPYYKCLDVFVEFMDKVFSDFIESNQIQKLLTSKEHFDLVITEAYTIQEFTLVLGHIFKAPVIALQAFTTNSVVNSVLGNSLSIAHIPDTGSPLSNKMSFFDRLFNTFYVMRNLYYVYYNQYIPKLEQKLREHFPDAPPLLDMMNNVSLVFINDHLTADYAQPRTPNIIPVAGIHIEDERPLPQAIQKFMDDATDGVILFSLGTYVPDELQPKEYFDMFIRVFMHLKQRVLWKTRKDGIQGLPRNVMTVKWAPQRDVLAHPKCVLFITHGGLLSQHEVIHSGVPVVVIPHFFDQHRNARFYEEQGIGVQINSQYLAGDTISSAIQTVLGNSKYASNVKTLSSVFRDRPMTPAETVVFWTEYILRHGGSHLRPASTQLSWYQLALLDVTAAILAVLFTIILIMYLIFQRMYKQLCGSNKNVSKNKEKTK